MPEVYLTLFFYFLCYVALVELGYVQYAE